MPTMTELAGFLLFATAIVVYYIFMKSIQDPAARKEMGIRLPEDDQL